MLNKSQDGNRILWAGLERVLNPDEFREAAGKVSEAAFAAVFQAQDEGKLQWKRDGDNFSDLVADAVVKNGHGVDITVPVILFTCISGDDGSKDGYLMLGSKHNSPCRNTCDVRVKRLYTQVTKEEWR